jgi:hypothetical protein
VLAGNKLTKPIELLQEAFGILDATQAGEIAIHDGFRGTCIAASQAGREEPAPNGLLKRVLRHGEAHAADEVERIRKEQRVVGGDHLPTAKSSADQRAQELVPMAQGEHMRLCLLQDRKLLLPLDSGKLSGLDVFATEHEIDTL